MNGLRRLWRLFVDDGRDALAIVLWLLLAWWGLPWLRLPAIWNAPIFAAGLLWILAWGVLRKGRG